MHDGSDKNTTYSKHNSVGEKMLEKLKEAKETYLNKRCWKSVYQKKVIVGTIIEVRYFSSWVEAKVAWDSQNQNSWEKVANLGFEELPRLFKGDS